MLVPVYDIANCGPRHRFGANGKLVHNSNWQNFRRGGEIRKSIVAPQGSKLVIGDLSQIEYRLALWLTGQHDKLQALADGVDLYCEFASDFYGEAITKEDKPRRGVGKQGILMGIYGAGAETQIRTAAGGGYGPPVYLDYGEGLRVRDLFREGHPCVTAFWRWCDRVIPVLGNGGTADYKGVIQIRDHRIWFPNGTAMNYEGMRYASNDELFEQEPDGEGKAWWEPTRKGWSRMWGSKLTADIIQGLARVVIARALTSFVRRWRLALQVHDELVAVVPDSEAGAVTVKPITIEDAVPGTAMHYMLECLLEAAFFAPDLQLEAEGIVSERYEK